MKFFHLYISILAVSAVPVLSTVAAESAVAPGNQVSALVQTAVVSMRTVTESLRAFGSVEPGPRQLREIVAPRASEVQLDVVAGTRVQRGTPLVTLTATPEAAVLYAQAQSQEVYAASALKRTRTLFKQRLATRDQLAAAQKALLDARANLMAQQQMGGGQAAILRAPVDGVVGTVMVASGARVAANTTLMTLVAQGGLYARLGVSLQRAATVRVGMPVVLRPVFNPQVSFVSRVTQVSGVVNAASGLMDVLAPIAGKKAGEFVPGSDVNASLELQSVHTLAVPRSAVLRDARGAYVFIIKNHIAHRVNVKTDADDGHWIAVSGALRAGERVVTLGNYELTDGMAVREQMP
jgi:membrane fusion protein (multidrug efflux system)